MAGDKQSLREQSWAALQTAGAARFPGTRGRIPNFTGAEAAAARLTQTELWQGARVLKCNPDSPQRPVRHAALKAGKVVVLALPKLRDVRPFLVLDPAVLAPGDLWAASAIKGSDRLGVAVAPEHAPDIDLIVTGCVAVDASGARLGKGGGYSDLEYAVLRELGMVGADTPIVTTVHDSQVLEEGIVPMRANDISLDLFCTATRTIDCQRQWPRPKGVDPTLLSEVKRAAIPILRDRAGVEG